ncbi:VWA domain-containing protein [Edaphobacter bradus]|uniref:VWA domain-containing protein n=1 Tax=Edaphobacter bradus TaxID=2259016 RepID=UPI0021E0F0F4|nr:VWA domain-containing protein [Edaphobacter bradus]
MTSSLAQQPPPSETPTIRENARIVVIDVVVTDSKNQPVHNLKASDFVVREDNLAQTIRHFDETAATPTIATPSLPQPKLPPNTFTNVVTGPQGSALNIILLDALNTPQTSQPSIRSQLKILAETLPPGSRVAIFGLSNDLVMLQGFTSDPAVLKAVLARAAATATLQAASASETSASLGPMVMSSSGAYEASPYDPGSALATFNRSVDNFQTEERVRQTVDAFTQLSRYLAALPGRKNLIWVSGSFPLGLLVDTDSAQMGARIFDNSVDFSKSVTRISDELSKSRVAIYPVDGRGVQADSTFFASNSSGPPGSLRNDPGRIARESSAFESRLISEQSTMLRLADDTGGHAFYGSNDISGLITKAIDSGSNYYTLTYVPTNKNWNGKQRKIKVALEGHHYQLAYRTGYIASDNPVTPSNQQSVTESQSSVASAIAVTMKRGAPNPSEILFKVLVTPSGIINPPAQDTSSKAAKHTLAAVSLHSQRRYHIDYAVDPRDIHWDDEHGTRSANLEFMIIGYDAIGNIMNDVNRVVPLHLTEQDYAAAIRGGLQLSQEIAMPAKGDFYLRLGVIDKTTNNIGTLEVSTAALTFPKS